MSLGSQNWLIEILDGGWDWVKFFFLSLVGRDQSLNVGGGGSIDVEESEEAGHEVEVNNSEDSLVLPVSSSVENVFFLSSSDQSSDFGDWVGFILKNGRRINSQTSVWVGEMVLLIFGGLQEWDWFRSHLDIGFVFEWHPTQVNKNRVLSGWVDSRIGITFLFDSGCDKWSKDQISILFSSLSSNEKSFLLEISLYFDEFILPVLQGWFSKPGIDNSIMII